ncbi:unnamed protein product, partial [Laminaria digitata]
MIGGGVVQRGGVGVGLGVPGEMGLPSAPGGERLVVAAHGQSRRRLAETLSLSELMEMVVVPEGVSGFGQTACAGGAGMEAAAYGEPGAAAAAAASVAAVVQWGGLRLAEPAGVDSSSLVVCQDGFVVRPSLLPASVWEAGLNVASGDASGGSVSGAASGGTVNGGAVDGGSVSGAVNGGAASGAANSVNAATLQTLSMFDPPWAGTLPFGTLPGPNDPIGTGSSCGVGVEPIPGGWTLAGAGVPSG